MSRVATPLRLEVTGTGSGDEWCDLGLKIENHNRDALFAVEVVEAAGLTLDRSTPWTPPWTDYNAPARGSDRAIPNGGFGRITLLTRYRGVSSDEHPQALAVPVGPHSSVVNIQGTDAHLRIRIWNRTLRKHADWMMRFWFDETDMLRWSLAHV